MKLPFLNKIDFIILSLMVILMVIGSLAVFSATQTAAAGTNYFERHVMFAVTGVILFLILSYLPSHFIPRIAYPLYGLSLILLIAVLLAGSRGFGADRWLAVGGLKIQPSELAKITTIMAVAGYLSKRETNINELRPFLIVCGMILMPFLLIARQPDLGTSLVFLALLLPILFWSGLNWFALFVLITPILTMVLSFNFYAFMVWMLIISAILFFSRRKFPVLAAVFSLHIFVGLVTPAMWAQLKPYQQQRILTFVNPEADPRGAGYQIIQSQVAIGSGGFWGKGFTQGSQTQLKFLPAQHTDFIFSVIGEEWGFLGVAAVLAIFIVLMLYLLYIATIVRAPFSSIVIIGVATVLFFHVFVNIGMTVGLAPVTGLPLPFLSYGGSFMLSVSFMLGLVSNFSRNRFAML